MRFKEPELRKARIEIVPMIDTIFFLLVFFMITWLSMVKMNGLGLKLPRENHSAGKAPVSLVLSLSPTGKYYLNSHATTETAWPDRLSAQLAEHPGSVVVLNVAPQQKTQELVTLLDSVNQVVIKSHSNAQVIVATTKVNDGSPKEKSNASR